MRLVRWDQEYEVDALPPQPAIPCEMATDGDAIARHSGGGHVTRGLRLRASVVMSMNAGPCDR